MTINVIKDRLVNKRVVDLRLKGLGSFVLKKFFKLCANDTVSPYKNNYIEHYVKNINKLLLKNRMNNDEIVKLLLYKYG